MRSSSGTRFTLPTRIRSTVSPVDGVTTRLQLADRIADLPGVIVTDDDSSNGPFVVRLMLGLAEDKPVDPALLCPFAEISRDGIALHGLRSWDKHQVLSRGWGKLRRRNVLLFLPRDERELETCWSIINKAHEALTDTAAVRSSQAAFFADLPRPVRPSLL